MKSLSRIRLILVSVAAWALASATCFYVPEWSQIDSGVPLALLGAAFLCLATSSSDRKSEPSVALASVALVLGLALALSRDNFEFGLILAAGGLLSFFDNKHAASRPVSQALIAIGLLMSIFDFGFPVWERFSMASEVHLAFTNAAMFLMSAAGVETTSVAGGFAAELDFGTQIVASDWGKLGGYFIVVFPLTLAALSSFLFPRKALLRVTVAGIVTTIIYAILRLAAAVAVSFSLHPQMDPFVLPEWVLISFFPLVFVTAAALPRRVEVAETDEQLDKHKPYLTVPARFALVMGGAFVLSVSVNSHTLGEKAQGKIFFDEAHSTWERADREFDREYFGKGSTYNYAEFLELLRTRGEVIHHQEGEITAKALEEAQVIVLKTPTKRYSEKEKRLILERVEDGAGLWLIGDHTNLYGMSTILNEFSRPAGITFEADSTFDFLSGGPTFHHEIGVPHPAARGVDGMAYQTSCSIRPASLAVQPVLVGRRMTSELADYGHRNFFSNITTELHDRIGSFHQASAANYGKGRILVFSDSTVLSNFSIYASGITALVHSSVDWLSHTSGFLDRSRSIFLILGMLLLVLGLVFTAMSTGAMNRALISGLIVYAVVFAVSNNSVAHDSERGRSDEMFREMAVVQDVSNFVETSFLEEAQAPGDQPYAADSISTFMNWSMRLGKVRPSIAPTVADAAGSGARVIVLFEPDVEPDSDQIRELNLFVAKGGTLLIADDIRNTRSSKANRWARQFGLEFGLVNEKFPVNRALADRRMPISHRFPFASSLESVSDLLRVATPLRGEEAGMMERHRNLVVVTGKPLLLDSAGSVIMAEKSLGSGKVIAFSNSYALTNAVLGGRYDPKPDKEKRKKYDAVFSVLMASLMESTND